MSYSIDANLLLYASDEKSPFHEKAIDFLNAAASRSEMIGLAWTTVMAYLRIATHPGIFTHPLTPRVAMENIESLVTQPQVRLLHEDEGFWPVYREVADRVVARGNLVPDAHLAALLLFHGFTTLYTSDVDFRKFEFLEVRNPL